MGKRECGGVFAVIEASAAGNGAGRYMQTLLGPRGTARRTSKDGWMATSY